MKKFFPAFFSYSIFAAAAVWTVCFFLLPQEPVAQGSELAYKTTNALCSLFEFLPSILLTAFLLACSISFSATGDSAKTRFSAEIAKTFRKLLIAALVISFVASIGTLVLLPFEKSKKVIMQEIPGLLAEYKSMVNIYRLQKNPAAAIQYIKRAVFLAPNNQELKTLERQVEAELKEIEAQKRDERNKSYAETDFNSGGKSFFAVEEGKMSPQQMLKKAEELFSDKDFFGAHYLSIQAERLFSPDDAQLERAKELAKSAWAKLQAAQREELTAGNIFFAKKMQGYIQLTSGNFEEAYYIFHDLSQEDARKARDPDVVRYLTEARERLLENYFFIDETYDVSRFESAKNVQFSVHKKNGESDVFLIRGVTDVEGTGGSLRYLRGLTICSFDQFGKFKYKMTTPYAKMKAVSVRNLPAEIQGQLALDSAAKSIPYLQLRSVDRSSREHKNEPIYTFKDQSHGEGENQIFVPIPYQDFTLIARASQGNGNLNPFNLNRLARKAPDYGYSSEVFSVESLDRIFYPFMLLIIMIFVATIAWNYRLSEGAIFKFKWIFILPSLNVVFYFTERLVAYLIKLLNLVFITMTGTRLALLAGIAVYIMLLFAVSALFLSRKKE